MSSAELRERSKPFLLLSLSGTSRVCSSLCAMCVWEQILCDVCIAKRQPISLNLLE